MNTSFVLQKDTKTPVTLMTVNERWRCNWESESFMLPVIVVVVTY